MESPVHSLSSLFKQLGLPDDPVSIEKFVSVHSPLKSELHLADAFSGRAVNGRFCVRRFWRMRIGLRWWMS